MNQSTLVMTIAVVLALAGALGAACSPNGSVAVPEGARDETAGEEGAAPAEPVRVSGVEGAEEPSESALVVFPEPYTVPDDSRALQISYSGDLPGLRVRLYGTDEEPLRELPVPAPALAPIETSYQVPLIAGEEVAGFRLVSEGDGSDAARVRPEAAHTEARRGEAELRSARIEPARFRARFGDRRVELGGGAFWERSDDALRVRFEDAVETVALDERQMQLKLHYRMPDDPAQFWERPDSPDRRPPSIELELEGRGGERRSKRYRVTLQPGANTVYLYSGEPAFRPEAVRIVGEHPALELHELEVESVARHPYEGNDGMEHKPLPADLGTVIEYPQELWRRSEYELFAWSVHPELLVLDTAALDYQSRMFKRLAFFYEKNEHRGTLLTNEELEGKHGWNAHNYSPEGLAAFFNLADESGFELNPEEYHLAEIAEANGVIERHDGEYRPGEGGVLSFSRQLPWLRRVFLTHEAMHGLFYMVDAFREFTFEYWEALDPEEREFWRLFFEFRDFDPDYEYLMVNEFQAYLLQQSVEIVEEYFFDTWIDRLKADRSDRASWISSFLERYPDTFSRSARDLERALWEHTGFTGGDVLRVRRIRD